MANISDEILHYDFSNAVLLVTQMPFSVCSVSLWIFRIKIDDEMYFKQRTKQRRRMNERNNIEHDTDKIAAATSWNWIWREREREHTSKKEDP